MKECFKCKVSKPLSEFYKHGRMGDGHLNKCKDCTKFDARDHRAQNLERIRQYDRDRSNLPHRKELAARIAKEYTTNNPDRRKAHVTLGNAIRDGRIIPWPVCAIPECNSKSEAHHPDYSRPLDVVWLCRHHHRRAHHDYKLKQRPK